MMKIIRILREKNGHYIVEASIILPIFLIGIISLSGVISIYKAYENIYFTSVDEARLSMVNTYMIKEDLLLPSRVEKRIKQENKDVNQVNVFGFKSGFNEKDNNSLMAFSFNYKMNIKSPLPLVNKTEKEKQIVFRKFIGDCDKHEAFTFDRMTKSENADLVCIFPNDGVRYHKSNCSYVVPKTTAITLSENIKNEYRSCSICGTNKAKIGSRVYVFLDYGDAYHFENCDTIKRNYIEIDREIAEKKGYTPCSKCGG